MFSPRKLWPIVLLSVTALALTGCRAPRSYEPPVRTMAPPRGNDAFFLMRNARVEEYIAIYNRSGLPQVLWPRAQPYLPTVRKIFEDAGLPRELCLLPLIESGFRPDARTERAAGLWQFVEGTAKDMGLVVGVKRDERLNWELSTHAAARYLSLLGSRYGGDWALVLAAYNAGPGTIDAAMAEQQQTDYWKLKLRPETMKYVPKFLAMLQSLRGDGGK